MNTPNPKNKEEKHKPKSVIVNKQHSKNISFYDKRRLKKKHTYNVDSEGIDPKNINLYKYSTTKKLGDESNNQFIDQVEQQVAENTHTPSNFQ